MPLENIMVGPPMFCFPDDELEAALDAMQQNQVHRLYVRGAESNDVAGVIAYPDIVGLLYRYCRTCEKGLLRARRSKDTEQMPVSSRVKMGFPLTVTRALGAVSRLHLFLNPQPSSSLVADLLG